MMNQWQLAEEVYLHKVFITLYVATLSPIL